MGLSIVCEILLVIERRLFGHGYQPVRSKTRRQNMVAML